MARFILVAGFAVSLTRIPGFILGLPRAGSTALTGHGTNEAIRQCQVSGASDSGRPKPGVPAILRIQGCHSIDGQNIAELALSITCRY